MRGLMIAAALFGAAGAQADTIFKLDLSKYKDGQYSFQNNNDDPGQSMYFSAVGIGPWPGPLGRNMAVVSPPGPDIIGWFESSQASLAGKDSLSAAWTSMYILSGQRLYVGLRADHFNEVAGVVARAGTLYLSAGGKETAIGSYAPGYVYRFGLSVDFAQSYTTPRAQVAVRRYASTTSNAFDQSFTSPWITFNASYDYKAAQRFLLTVEGHDTIKNGGYGLRISNVEIDAGLTLTLPKNPLPNAHCHSSKDAPLKIVCDGPVK